MIFGISLKGLVLGSHLVMCDETERELDGDVPSPAIGLRSFQNMHWKSSRLFQDFPNMMTNFFRHNSINLVKKKKKRESM